MKSMKVGSGFKHVAAAVAAMFVAVTGWATTYTWTGGAGDGNWSSAGNWDVGSGCPSTADDTAVFPANAAANVCLDDTLSVGTLVLTNLGMNVVFTQAEDASLTVGTLNLGTTLSTVNGRTKVTFDGCTVTAGNAVAFNPGVFLLVTGGSTVQVAGSKMIMTDNAPYPREARLEVRGKSTYISTGECSVMGSSVVLIDDSEFDCRGSFYVDCGLKYQEGGWGRVCFEGSAPLLKVSGSHFDSNGRDSYKPCGADFIFSIPTNGYTRVPVQYTGSGTFMKKSNSNPYTQLTRFTAAPDSPHYFSTNALEQTLVTVTNPMTAESLIAEQAFKTETLDSVARSADNLSLVYRRAAQAEVLTVTATPFEVPGPDYATVTGLVEGATRTLTAPAHPSDADYVTCTGYNLYDVDPVTLARTKVAGSPFAGTTCSYTHGKGRRELEWIWSVPTLDVAPAATALESGAALQAALDRYAYATVNVAPGTYDLPAGSAFLVTNAINLVGGADDPYLTQLRVSTISPRSFTVEISNALARVSRVLMTNRGSGSSQSAGAARLWDGLVEHCIVSNCNNGTSGGLRIAGSIHMDKGTIRDTLVCDCRHDRYDGGGIGMADGLVDRCRVTRCYSEGYDEAQGGGIYASGGTIRNTLVDHCRGRNGASGIYVSGVVMVENCTVADNSSVNLANIPGIYVSDKRAVVRNTISWNNVDKNSTICDVGNSGYTTYECCDASSGLDAERGNLSVNPTFDAQYRLGFSACVGGAEKLWWMPSSTDLAGEARIKGSAPDLGVYERDVSSKLMCSFSYTYHDGVDNATLDVVALADGVHGEEIYIWTVMDAKGNVVQTLSGHEYASHTFNLTAGIYTVKLRVEEGENADEVTQKGIARVRASEVYLNEVGLDKPPYATRADGCHDFETALDLTANGGTLWVAPGTYVVSNAVEFTTRGVTIASLEGPIVTTLKSTAGGNISANTRPTFVLGNADAKLVGVTVTTSVGSNRGLVQLKHSDAVVSNCVIRDATGHYYTSGVGVNMTAGKLVDTTIRGLSGSAAGGSATPGAGLYMTGGLADRCVVSNCTHSGGTGVTVGGAVYVSGGDVRNSLFADNRHKETAPVYVCGTAIFDNCTVVTNCSQNKLDSGREVAAFRIGGSAMARNCIFYGNYNTYGGATNAAVEASASLVASLNGADPRFRTVKGVAWQLRGNSPCVNMGAKLDWMTERATDLLGNPRVHNRIPDMGCYENQSGGLMLLVR